VAPDHSSHGSGDTNSDSDYMNANFGLKPKDGKDSDSDGYSKASRCLYDLVPHDCNKGEHGIADNIDMIVTQEITQKILF